MTDDQQTPNRSVRSDVFGGLCGALLFADEALTGLWLLSGGLGAAAARLAGRWPRRSADASPGGYRSYLIVDADPGVSNPVTSSTDVAHRIADAFRKRCDPLSHATVGRDGDRHPPWQPYAIAHEQIEPLELDDGRRARLITVEVEGSRSCVVVLDTQVAGSPRHLRRRRRLARRQDHDGVPAIVAPPSTSFGGQGRISEGPIGERRGPHRRQLRLVARMAGPSPG